MGWTSYNATHYTRAGVIDRKAECDEAMTGANEYGAWEVLKSCVRGSVYYAAVKRTQPTGESYVFGAVCLTSVNSKDYFNFAYKDMSEDMHPFYYDCPASILDLLTPTDSESANEWRRRCREHAENQNALGKLPIGAVIEYEIRGKIQRAQKCAPAYQFKTPWWSIGPGYYIKKKDIPKNFTVVPATVTA